MSRKEINREHNRKQKLAQRMAARFVRDEMPEIWEDIRRAVGIDVDWANECKPRQKRKIKTRKPRFFCSAQLVKHPDYAPGRDFKCKSRWTVTE